MLKMTKLPTTPTLWFWNFLVRVILDLCRIRMVIIVMEVDWQTWVDTSGNHATVVEVKIFVYMAAVAETVSPEKKY